MSLSQFCAVSIIAAGMLPVLPMVSAEDDEVPIAAAPPTPGEIWGGLAAPAIFFSDQSPPAVTAVASTQRERAFGTLKEMDWPKVFTATETLPDEHDGSDPATAGRNPYFGSGAQIRFHWAARNAVHRTLYFEDLALERYGQSRRAGVQPLASAAIFVSDWFLVPCRMFRDPPCELHYTLGLKRPGSCAAQVIERVLPPRSR